MPPLIKIERPNYTTGDLWDYHRDGYWVVVTTNIGWTKDGRNVMGRGIAQQAAGRFPGIEYWYGQLCYKYRQEVGICLFNEGRLIMLPVKPLDSKNPHLSWKQPADLGLIERGLIELAELQEAESLKRIALSYPGCGNGGLDKKQVKPLLAKYLNSKFTVVDYGDK